MLMIVVGLLVGVSCGDGGSREGSAPSADPIGPSTSMVAPATTSPLEGPAAVGITTIHLTDPSRPLKARGGRPSATSRSFDVVMRYPIAGVPGVGETLDAAPLGAAPLVVFAHGFAAETETYAALLHEIAASGFVVAAPEFPMTSAAIDGAPDEMDLVEEPRDLSFIIDSLTSDPRPANLGSMVRQGPVGLVGHSDGAQAVLLCAYAPRYRDDRVGAVVALSGRLDAFGGRWFSAPSAPLLAIHGSADGINPIDRSRELVEADPYPAMFVSAEGGSHLEIASDPRFVPAVARLIADDLRWRLMDAPGARGATSSDASVAPLELVAIHD